MQTKIRLARPEDAEAAAGLMAQLAEFGHNPVAAGVGDRFRRMVAAPNQAIFVAEDGNGHAVGLLSITRRTTLWHESALIEELVVDHDARGQGAGRALIQAALDWARAAGCAELEVGAVPHNADALAFYRRLGFESIAILLEHEFDEGGRKGAGEGEGGTWATP